jgi:hypothetical protein
MEIFLHNLPDDHTREINIFSPSSIYWEMGWEAQSVKLVPQPDLKHLLNVRVDRQIAADFQALYAKAIDAGGGALEAGLDSLAKQAAAAAKKAADTAKQVQAQGLANYKKSLIAGKDPSAKAKAAFAALDEEAKASVLAEIETHKAANAATAQLHTLA